MTEKVVSREEWLVARKALLAQEREVTRQRDALAAARRALPWVKVEKDYVFQSEEGPRSLESLFNGRSQLFVQHFMLTPNSDHICSGCALLADGVDAARQHFEQADLSYVAISRASVEQIEMAKKRMGWTFPWVSSGQNSFNYDYGVSFTPEQVAEGKVNYNFGTTPYQVEEMHGSSVFNKDEEGTLYHSYSAYARGAETLITPFSFLDFTPKGRNEEGTMSWVRLHDSYGK